MNAKNLQVTRLLLLGIVLVTSAFHLCGAPVVSITTLASFYSTNGANPAAGLILGTDGNFYGTASAGGVSNAGTVFEITPAGTLSTLAFFYQTNGATPSAGLLQGQDGNLYGTTSGGGTKNSGTIFKLVSPGTLNTLVSLSGASGAVPYASLALGPGDRLYGTASLGGGSSAGCVFEVTTNGGLRNVVSFDYRGFNPYAGLVWDGNDTFYGTTFQGGTYGYGAVYKLTTNGTFTPLYSFTGTNDGANPSAGLTLGADGVLYGATFYGGTNGFGTLYRITTNGVFHSLVSFNGTNGAFPYSDLMRGADDQLYGTTEGGGAYTNSAGYSCGTVFRLTTNGVFTSLASFAGTNGAYPQARLVQGPDGALYGTTFSGGAADKGTVFRLSIALPPRPEIKTISRTASAVVLTWSAVPGEVYQVQYLEDLNRTDWRNLGGPVTASQATAILSYPTGPEPQRFFRVALLPWGE